MQSDRQLEASHGSAAESDPGSDDFPIWLRLYGEPESLGMSGLCQHVRVCSSAMTERCGQGTPFVAGTMDVPCFNREALIAGLRLDQAGESTFTEFLQASWRAGVVRYDVDFAVRTVVYCGSNGEEYLDSYPAVEISQ